ncbi:Hint domain-containing protein [Jannaschia donghaensis]|uniref:Hedgehog/Intein (Hint) domain-containing protein n=1 Tax=Jannaschia donghaensis TaxID=420998 RepID=A0A0M6YHN7_9RHOB|nr:Hint domain-containing protein [Jannaschia donghaensis]CTQ48777.1 hypothetical protein JDO7802_00782 [Jannaschia donghaensis]
MASSYSVLVYSALNLTGADGQQAFESDTIDGSFSGEGPYTTGQEDASRLTIDDNDEGEDGQVFNDGVSRAQFTENDMTFTYIGADGEPVTTTFPAGTQIQSEFSTTMTSGYTVHGLRLRDPETDEWVTAGYYLEPPPGGDPTPPPGTNLGEPNGWNDQGHKTMGPQCLMAGTMIATALGDRAIETLRAGDMVRTDLGLAPLIWTGLRVLPVVTLRGRPDWWPIRIAAGVLGNDRPLCVSPQHRVLLHSAQAALIFGADQVLVPARALVAANVPRVAQPCPTERVIYCHLACRQHRLVRAAGAWVETLLDGDEMAGGAAIRGGAARPCLTVREAKTLLRCDGGVRMPQHVA